MSEKRRCQLRALLNEVWGKVESAKPALRIVGGTTTKATGCAIASNTVGPVTYISERGLDPSGQA